MAQNKTTTEKPVKKTAIKKVSVSRAPVRKAVVKTESILAVKKSTGKKTVQADVFDLKGKVVDQIDLPQSLFGVKVNNQLMAQAVRIYLANQRRGTSSTKSRGEVQGSTRKIYKQKGTGRARHGGIRAPLFVGGGIAFGPKPRSHTMHLPQKMKQRATLSALTAKLQSGNIKIVTGFSALKPKTKEMVSVLGNLSLQNKKMKILLVVPSLQKANDMEHVTKAARNILGVSILSANMINTYDILNAKSVLLLKESIAAIQEVFDKKSN